MSTAARWLPPRPPALPPGYTLLPPEAEPHPGAGSILLTPDGAAYSGPARAAPLPQSTTATSLAGSTTTPARPSSLPCDGCPATDTRTVTPSTSAFPYSAVGALTGTVPGTPGRGVTCTGALIGPRHVLTAAHCVWNREANAGVMHLTFTPGQAGPYSEFHAPLGEVKAAWARLLASFPRSGPYALPAMAADVALVTLAKPVHRAAGWLAVPHAEAWPGSGAGAGATPPPPTWGGASAAAAWNLTTAGYPSDKAVAGGGGDGLPSAAALGQWRVGCRGGALAQDFTAAFPECGGGVCQTFVRHGCPSMTGQSGSPMWTADGLIRGVLIGSLEVDGGGAPASTLNLGVRPSHPSIRATLAGWHAEDEGGAELIASPSGQQPMRRLVRVAGVWVVDLNDAGTVAGLVVGGVVASVAALACVGVCVARCVRRRRRQRRKGGLESPPLRTGKDDLRGVVQVTAVAAR